MDGKSYLLLVDEIINFSKKKSFSRDGLLLLINAFYNATASLYTHSNYCDMMFEINDKIFVIVSYC